MPENLAGIHHVTCITKDVQKNVDFYVSVLGLRFIKQTVNFDVPDTYHLYFGDYLGTPGSAMTFFGWPRLPWRPAGNGQVTVVSFAIPEASIEFWGRRLKTLGVDAARSERFGTAVLTLHDPDQIAIELVAEADDQRWVPWPDGPVDVQHAIRSFHSVTLSEQEAAETSDLLTATLSFRRIAGEGNRTRYATGDGGPHSIVDVLEVPEAPFGDEGTGTVHHVAWRAQDDAHQLAWRQALVAAHRNVTPVIDRKYFHSIYFREPGGVLFEIATDQPGFAVDESPEALGSGLQLPPQYENRRSALTVRLQPLVVPASAMRRSNS